MVSRLRSFKPDFLLTGIVTALILGLVIPVPDDVAAGLSIAADIGVAMVFLVYGMRLRTSEVIEGLKNVKLQGAVLATTYVIFPLVGLAFYWITGSFIGTAFATGLLYLSLLPSTVQSSVTFVSIARGDVAAAVCAATISNILGMFITPLLVLIFMDLGGASTGGIDSVLLKLLLPFVVGQLLQPKVGEWMRAHRNITRITDNSAIILVVFSAVVKATNDGAWSSVTIGGFAVLVVVLALMLAIIFAFTWHGGKLLGFARAQKIVLLMCGSKKSLATGLPMAKALFDPALVGAIAVPVIIFHQMQLMVAAVIARRLGSEADN
ncbi:bile acid:sodium symporter family protein [Trueperella bialowiezensis]|uniref:Sodium Bile acid symporter family n=1 Tax=Trueperella bialowiezensis TaxID=312285 RepID=A0A448PBP2_9ACTO|nr:bile acid:sodium symporter family protein [Trueperella bialowiezensis]VEI12399.1 Sodium Bile acid symporter family [Trueperella bialowiezensis]